MTAVSLPGESGVAYAFRRMYDAWRATQPQLFWTDSELEGGDTVRHAGSNAVASLEPARLNGGAEPNWATPEALTAHSPVPPATPNAGGSAPYPYDGPAATFLEAARRGQEVTLDVR